MNEQERWEAEEADWYRRVAALAASIGGAVTHADSLTGQVEITVAVPR